MTTTHTPRQEATARAAKSLNQSSRSARIIALTARVAELEQMLRDVNDFTDDALIGRVVELEAALRKIASCQSHHPDDVVAIARAALKESQS